MKNILLFTTIFCSSISFAQMDSIKQMEAPLVIAEKMPSFPGGIEAMLKFVQDNIKYPKTHVSGPNCSYVTFIVEKDGSLTGIKILRASQGGSVFDDEALRIVSKMPIWIPGMQNGYLVRVQFNMPIKFTLK